VGTLQGLVYLGTHVAPPSPLEVTDGAVATDGKPEICNFGDHLLILAEEQDILQFEVSVGDPQMVEVRNCS